METLNEMWDALSSSDQQMFKKCCRRLLKETFIVRDKDEESRRMFFFVSTNEVFFSNYLNYMGFEIAVKKDNGVVMLQNMNSDIVVCKQKFNKFQSIILCCLWTLYMDKIHSGSLSKLINISLPELNAELEKYDFKGAFDVKNSLKIALQLFARYNLIYMNWNLPDNERVIVLYPSIQFALDDNEFAVFATSVQERMASARVQSDELVEDEMQDNSEDDE